MYGGHAYAAAPYMGTIYRQTTVVPIEGVVTSRKSGPGSLYNIAQKATSGQKQTRKSGTGTLYNYAQKLIKEG